MTPSLEDLGITRLSIEQRMLLAEEILDSVAAERPLPPLSAVKSQELRRRLAVYATNPNDVVPWEKIEAEALARMKK